MDETLFGWIHISDIHFGHGDASHGWDQELVMGALRRDIAARPAPVRVDAIFVTGDIAFSGAGRSPDEYAKAKKWLLEAGHAAGVGPESIFLVPGNHDVDRGVDGRSEELGRLVKALRSRGTPERSIDEVLKDMDGQRKLLAGRMEKYLELSAAFGPWAGRDPMPPAVERLYWVHAIDARGGLRVRLVGLNTSLLSRDDEDLGQLRLGNEQLARAFAADRAPNELILALSHHPLRKGWLGDESNADRWMRASAHAHLSGHVHEAESEGARSGTGGSFVRVVAGAAHNDQIPAWIPQTHGYNYGEVRRGDGGKVVLRVHPRLWSPPSAAFVLDVHSVPPATSGQQPTFAEHEIRLTLPGAARTEPAPKATPERTSPRVPSSGAVRVFLSYAQENEAQKKELEKALAGLRRSGAIEITASRSEGEVPRGGVDAKLQEAHVVLLLLTQDYLASDYCFEVEMEAARKRHEAGDAVVWAVLLQEVEIITRADFKRIASGEREEAWYEKLPRLPYATGRDQNMKPTGRNPDGIPVSTWARADNAWTELAREIREQIEERRRAR